MVKIKMCGLTRTCDIDCVNELKPDYIGFVFAKSSKRFVDYSLAKQLKARLNSEIKAVGVFVNEDIHTVANLLEEGIIDIAQLHANESEEYIKNLRFLTDKPIIKAFRIDCLSDIESANVSSADYVLLDSGSGGTGTSFNWDLVKHIKRPYFLAGGLSPDNVQNALLQLSPFAVDVSSGIETDGYKDKNKMRIFLTKVRGKDNNYE